MKPITFPITEPVRALSWKEPFATLMLYGKIETRTWHTNYRGLVLICASKTSYSLTDVLSISDTLYQDIENICGYKWQMCLPGNAIAIGRLADCRPMTRDDEKKCFVRYSPDRWCHVYEDVTEIKPFPWKGRQGWTILDVNYTKKIELKTNNLLTHTP